MKILLLGFAYPPSVGGAQKLLGQIAYSCDPGKLAVIAGSENPAEEALYDRELKYAIRRLRLNPESLADRFSLKLRSLCSGPVEAFYDHCHRRGIGEARRLARELDPHVILCGWAYMLKTALALKTAKSRVVAIAYGTELIEASKNDYLKQLWRKADKVLAISNFTKRALVEIGVDSERVKLAFPGIDPSIAERNRAAPDLAGTGLKDKKIILTVCRLVPHKGTDRLIEAMPGILKAEPNAALVIVGEGYYRETLESMVKNKGLADAVYFTGRLEEEGLYGWYVACQVFAMPSRLDESAGGVEGYGYTFLEAGLFGKPVVGGDSGGIPDSVIDGHTGYLVNPHSSDAIAEALIALLKNPQQAENMGKAGRQWVMKERNERPCADLFLKEIMAP